MLSLKSETILLYTELVQLHLGHTVVQFWAPTIFEKDLKVLNVSRGRQQSWWKG